MNIYAPASLRANLSDPSTAWVLWQECLPSLELLAPHSVMRCNMISSIDGAMSLDGFTRALGTDNDYAIFRILRAQSDVVLVGSATVIQEKYGHVQVPKTLAHLRGNRPRPQLAIATSTVNDDLVNHIGDNALDPLIVVVATKADPKANLAVGRCHDRGLRHLVVDAELTNLRAKLAEIGLLHVLCEGGPRFLGAALAADIVDELFLTLSPMTVGGDGDRIVRGPAVQRNFQATGAFSGPDGGLYTRWARRPGVHRESADGVTT